MTQPPFRIIAPDNKGFRGLTSLDLGDGKAIAVADTGPEAEAVLVKAWEERR